MKTRKHGRTRSTYAALVALGVAAALALTGCGGDETGNEDAVQEDGSVDLSQVTLIVGDQKGGSKALLHAAGELDDVPYEIDWKEFTSGPPLLEAMNSGSIHVGGVGNTPPIFAAAAKSNIKVVQAATYGGLGDAIVVPGDSTLTSVADLEGKKVAVAKGSSANYNLLAQLEDAGLDYSDVKVQDLQPADALAAFSAGHIDAWAIWEPFTSQAEEAGGTVIADGSDLVNGYTFQVASQAGLDDPGTEAALADYLARIARAQAWASIHKEEWSTAWAAETGLPESVTLAAVTKRETKVVPIDEALISSEQDMADAFTEAGLLPGEVDLSEFFSSQYNEDVVTAGAA
jgi:sulfonate transport system substrate-binding protein